MQPDMLHMQTLHNEIVELGKQLEVLESELEAEDENIRAHS